MNQHADDRDFLHVQAAELRRLLAGAGDDPILVPQLRDRLNEVERELASAGLPVGQLVFHQPLTIPRAAIFLRGGGVHGSAGIRPSLAGEALIQYERMFVEQALHDEREAARSAGRRRRQRGTPAPELLFTGTPRGSFGLEFVPRASKAGAVELHGQSLKHVADALAAVAEGDVNTLGPTLHKIPARVLQPLKQFLKTLAEHGAELRLAFSDAPARSISAERLRGAAELLDREVQQDTIQMRGVFRGVTLESGVFDVRLDDGTTITGSVSDSLSEEDLERIDALTNQSCVVQLQVTTVRKVTGDTTTSYLLLNAEPQHQAD